MNKKLAGALLCAAWVIGTNAAIAGEITGNGKDITRHANSLCAFSGLNDTPANVDYESLARVTAGLDAVIRFLIGAKT